MTEVQYTFADDRFFGITVTITVDDDELVTGFVRWYEWADDFPNEQAVAKSLEWELRPGNYNSLSDAKRERADRAASAEAYELLDKYRDLEEPTADLKEVVDDAITAMKEAIERHKGTPLHNLTAALRDDWQSERDTERMFEESTWETVQAILKLRDTPTT
ncbi:hypothetical protein [Mycobacteroides abscessus]|uniref:hypothetical protein n=1 Tax=Mycobacteroides abscessus TaxID=36809 RepID=UPI00103EA42A|nr:hypothetical protein [Mycobacteroides abscessus]